MSNQFTAHNVRLDDGTCTIPTVSTTIDNSLWFKSAKRALNLAFGGELKGRSIVDLGCLEGGYATEFARLGMDALGIEVRRSNFENCMHVRQGVNLQNLRFTMDTAWNIAEYGAFDAVFCSGLLYHFDRPREFLHLISSLCKKIIIIHTHFATMDPIAKFGLSPLVQNEGLSGRWFADRPPTATNAELDGLKWASWENANSFWPLREHLIGAISDCGFDMVFEQYDWLETPIPASLTQGYYKTDNRGLFVGIKTGLAWDASVWREDACRLGRGNL